MQGRGLQRVERAVAALREAGHKLTATATRGSGSAAGIARDCIREGADLILVAGGDGAINEVLNGMIHEAVPLGILPAGTGNVLATELGLRGPMEDIARRVGEWIPTRLCAGLLTSDIGPVHRYFLMMAGVGFDARIVTRLDPGLKRSHGKLSYWITGSRELGRKLDEFEVRLNEKTSRVTFALASRVRNYGGSVNITRHAGLLRDDFGLALFEGQDTFRYLKYLAGALLNRLAPMSGVSILHVKSAEFHPCGEVPVYVEVDGELAGQLPARIEIVPDALTLLTPAGALSP